MPPKGGMKLFHCLSVNIYLCICLYVLFTVINQTSLSDIHYWVSLLLQEAELEDAELEETKI